MDQSERSYPSNPKTQQAILVFTTGPRTDLQRSGLKRRFSSLFQIRCLTPAIQTKADVHIFTTEAGLSATKGLRQNNSVRFHLQRGNSFGIKLRNAAETLIRAGYQRIILIGSDCPELQERDLQCAFANLSRYRLVLGPDHRGGCYLIGIRSEDCHKLWSISWQNNTDCAELQKHFEAEDIFLLKVKHDVDCLDDVRLLARCNNEAGVQASTLLGLSNQLRIVEQSFHTISLPTDLQRPQWQLPPPTFLPFPVYL